MIAYLFLCQIFERNVVGYVFMGASRRSGEYTISSDLMRLSVPTEKSISLCRFHGPIYTGLILSDSQHLPRIFPWIYANKLYCQCSSNGDQLISNTVLERSFVTSAMVFKRPKIHFGRSRGNILQFVWRAGYFHEPHDKWVYGKYSHIRWQRWLYSFTFMRRFCTGAHGISELRASMILKYESHYEYTEASSITQYSIWFGSKILDTCSIVCAHFVIWCKHLSV